MSVISEGEEIENTKILLTSSLSADPTFVVKADISNIDGYIALEEAELNQFSNTQVQDLITVKQLGDKPPPTSQTSSDKNQIARLIAPTTKNPTDPPRKASIIDGAVLILNNLKKDQVSMKMMGFGFMACLFAAGFFAFAPSFRFHEGVWGWVFAGVNTLYTVFGPYVIGLYVFPEQNHGAIFFTLQTIIGMSHFILNIFYQIYKGAYQFSQAVMFLNFLFLHVAFGKASEKEGQPATYMKWVRVFVTD